MEKVDRWQTMNSLQQQIKDGLNVYIKLPWTEKTYQKMRKAFPDVFGLSTLSTIKTGIYFKEHKMKYIKAFSFLNCIMGAAYNKADRKADMKSENYRIMSCNSFMREMGK